jgi:hypothetical protein
MIKEAEEGEGFYLSWRVHKNVVLSLEYNHKVESTRDS